MRPGPSGGDPLPMTEPRFRATEVTRSRRAARRTRSRSHRGARRSPTVPHDRRKVGGQLDGGAGVGYVRAPMPNDSKSSSPDTETRTRLARLIVLLGIGGVVVV